MIKVYTQPGRPSCHHATEYLLSRNVDIEEINIRKRPGVIGELQRLGVTATPAIIIDERLIIGFDQEAVDQAIANPG